VNAAPNNECRKLLLKTVTSTFRTSSSGRTAAKAPSNMATHTYIPGVNNLKFTKNVSSLFHLYIKVCHTKIQILIKE
jgi:hypothetical protein